MAKGYKTDCEVIYGDTDSVMVNFKVRGERVCARVCKGWGRVCGGGVSKGCVGFV